MAGQWHTSQNLSTWSGDPSRHCSTCKEVNGFVDSRKAGIMLVLRFNVFRQDQRQQNRTGQAGITTKHQTAMGM